MRLFLILLFIVIFSLTANTQELCILYEKTLELQQREGIESSLNVDLSSIMAAYKLKENLTISNTQSHYEQLATKDTIINGMYVKQGKSWADLHYYRDHDKKISVTTEQSSNPILVKEEEIWSVQKWKLRPDLGHKTIGGFVCQAAELVSQSEKSTTIAWFTLEILIKEGPEKYHGLPGLILKIEKSDATIVMVSLAECYSECESLTPPNGRVLSVPDFEAALDKLKSRGKL